ncbi:MAG TPA: hypothetical protein VHZ33_00185 [Trebonia sp.]|nr:hypothetical protein [Trebonia sp.]
MPEGEGYAATPPDEREFPDLPPIRPSQARALDARVQDDWRGQPAQPGQYGQQATGGYGGGYQSSGPGYGQSGPSQAGPGYGQSGPSQADPGYGGGPYGPGQYAGGLAGPGQAGPGQAPWPDQDRPNQDWQAPPVQPAQAPPLPPVQPQQAQPQRTEAKQERQEEDVPSWAEPDSVEAFSARWHRRGLDSRDDRRSGRRKHRRTLFAAGGAVAVVIAVAVYFFAFDGSNGSPNLGLGSLVTTFLPGEVQSVPDACNTVPSATLSQYLPGTTKQAAPPLNSGTNTECSWTLDNPPTYRVLEAQIVAYTPSALVANPDGSGLVPAGNGSATYAAEAAYASFEYGLTKPAKSSGQPKATITDLKGMPGGDDTSAFAATQVLNKNGETFDVATVYVRYRNVIITAMVQGLEQTSGAKKYGPVSMSDLTAAAKTVAHEVAAKIV